MMVRILMKLGLGAVCMLFLLGCRSERTPQPIRIAANFWPGYEYLFLADHLGYYREEGVEVRLVETMSLADSFQAYALHQVDVMASTLIEFLLIREHTQRQPRIFLVCDYSHGADLILARAPIASIAELKGRRVGVEPYSVSGLLLISALARNGMNVADIAIVSLFPSALVEAAQHEKIDAAVTYSPVSTALRAMPGWNKVFDSSMVPDTILDVLVADEAELRRRPAEFAALIRAFYRARQYAADHPAEAIAAMSRRGKVSPEDLNRDLSEIRLISLEQQAEALSGSGSVARALDLTRQLPVDELGLPAIPSVDEVVDLCPLSDVGMDFP